MYLAGIDHDEELHEVVIDLPAAGLYDVHVLAPDTLPNLHIGLAIGELLGLDIGLIHSESVTDFLGEILMRVARKHFDVWHRMIGVM